MDIWSFSRRPPGDRAMTEKLTAWLFLMSLVVLTVSTAHHQRWSLDARPILIPIQYVTALIDR